MSSPGPGGGHERLLHIGRGAIPQHRNTATPQHRILEPLKVRLDFS
jgi:hypothetical protein